MAARRIFAQAVKNLSLMLIFLYGQDTYRSQQKLKEIISHHQKIHQSGLNLRIYDAQDLNFQTFRDEFQQTSMFKEKKLVVLENVFSNQKFKEEFLKNKEIFLNSEEIIVIFEESKILEGDKLTKFLKKNGKFQKFDLLEGQRLKNWLKKEFDPSSAEATEGKKTKIEEEALEKLIEFVGNDLWRLSNEIKKLISYKEGNSIREKDVELLVKAKAEPEIFETITAIAQKNKKKALKLIEKHLEKGDSPFYLLKMITYQFRNLIMIKALTSQQFSGAGIGIISQRTGINPYAIKKTMELTRKFSLEELKKIYRKIFEADFNIKTGKINPEDGIKMLIAEI